MDLSLVIIIVCLVLAAALIVVFIVFGRSEGAEAEITLSTRSKSASRRSNYVVFFK